MRIFGALVLCLFPATAGAYDLSGTATIIDGDSLTINGTFVELWGYDAPELDQQCSIGGAPWPCGKMAADHIKSFTHRKIVTCIKKPHVPMQMTAYKCSVGTLDLGAEMVEVGLAIPDWPISQRYYIRSYQEARGQGRGMHRGTFENPWEWRKKP